MKFGNNIYTNLQPYEGRKGGIIMSDDLKLTDTFRKIFLAGVGAVALGAEKSKAAIDSLVEKGELTVEQGKVLNQELKHKVDDAVADAKAKAKEKTAAKADSEKPSAAPKGDDFSEMLNSLTPEQLAALKEQLAAKDTSADKSAAAETPDD